MAGLLAHPRVYVAFLWALAAFLRATAATPGSVGSANVLSLLQPYDLMYYSGVRAYFGKDWAKAAELLEKSLLTKETLLRVRRLCHDQCEAAGAEKLDKLGKLNCVCVCVKEGGADVTVCFLDQWFSKCGMRTIGVLGLHLVGLECYCLISL